MRDIEKTQYAIITFVGGVDDKEEKKKINKRTRLIRSF